MTRVTVVSLATAALIAVGCGDEGDETVDRPAVDGGTTAQQRSEPETEPATMKAGRGAVVKVVSSEYGRVVADGKGEAFYLFDKEKGSRSECYGECAVAWPPVLTKGEPRAGEGARSGLLGTTKRRDGKLQVTYAGHPLYYYKDDRPGVILCQNVDEFGGLWLVVDPDGDAVT
jgi:predicted lipoprotein with Yx(FWY)xxD motif